MQNSVRTSWIKPVQDYVAIWRSQRDGIVPIGASAAALSEFKIKAQSLGFHIPEDYLRFLELVNGTSFDGMSFAGVGIPTDDSFRRGEFFAMNAQEFDATDGDATVYGSRQWLTWRYSRNSGAFEEVNEALDVEASFSSFGEMIAHAFNREVELLKASL